MDRGHSTTRRGLVLEMDCIRVVHERFVLAYADVSRWGAR